MDHSGGPTVPQADLDAWVLATAPRAVAYAASLLRDRGAAEDVVHDCYCRLLAKANVYDLPRDGLKLLLTSVTNACVNHNTRRRPALSLHAPREDEGGAAEVEDRATPAPESVAMGRELERAIGDALERLPQAQRAALELKSLGCSLNEIAEALSVSPTNAGVLVHRARRAMARHLAPFLEEKAG